MIARLAAIAFIAVALPAAAAPGSLQLSVQNDSGFGTDRGFSSGARLSWLAEGAFELGLVHQIHMPDASRDILGFADRPYAGRLLAFGARHFASADAGTPGHRLATVEVQAGVTGPSARGRQVQDFFHGFISSPETDWSRQRRDRFDGAVVVAETRELWRGAGSPWSVAGHAGANAGTVVGFLHGGLELRWGAPGSLASELLRHASTPQGKGAPAGFSAFAGASARRVWRNRLLEREADDPGLPLVRENVVGRIAAGGAWKAAWGTVSFAVAQETREIEGQPWRGRFWSVQAALPFD